MTKPATSNPTSSADIHVTKDKALEDYLTMGSKRSLVKLIEEYEVLGINLTMITDALNPSIGNESWESKQARIRNSLLVLNRNIADNAMWEEKNIENRGVQLAGYINHIWQCIHSSDAKQEAA